MEWSSFSFSLSSTTLSYFVSCSGFGVDSLRFAVWSLLSGAKGLGKEGAWRV